MSRISLGEMAQIKFPRSCGKLHVWGSRQQDKAATENKKEFSDKDVRRAVSPEEKKRSRASQPTLHVHSVLLHSDVKQHATKKQQLKFLLDPEKDQICPRNTEQLFSKRSDWNMKPIKRRISWISTFLFYITLIF